MQGSTKLPLLLAFLTIVIMLVLASWLTKKRKWYPRYDRAVKDGDYTEAKLASSSFCSTNVMEGDATDSWRCKYRYEVDGKHYTFTVFTYSKPEQTMTIYFDRRHGNKRIAPEKKEPFAKLVIAASYLMPVVVFIIAAKLNSAI